MLLTGHVTEGSVIEGEPEDEDGDAGVLQARLDGDRGDVAPPGVPHLNLDGLARLLSVLPQEQVVHQPAAIRMK